MTLQSVHQEEGALCCEEGASDREEAAADVSHGRAFLVARAGRQGRWWKAVAAGFLLVGFVTFTLNHAFRGNKGVHRAEAHGAVDLQAAPPPAGAARSAGPSLFCYTVMQLGGAEEQLVKTQLTKRCSIFQCEESCVMSSERVLIGTAEWGDVYTWKTEVHAAVSMGKYGVGGQKTDSFLNTAQFILSWDVLIESKRIWAYDFIVKVDPDAVFFADRLRKEVAPHIRQAVYFTNCGKWASGPKLYGALEVFSKEAIQSYAANVITCKGLDWEGKWGEDYYMQKCMDIVCHVPSVQNDNLVADKRCIPAVCTDYTKVAFHHFKDVASYFDCWGQATHM